MTPILLLAIAYFATVYGLQIRRAVWEGSADGRFSGDIANAFRWGERASNYGLYNFYDEIEINADRQGSNDYPPLRITVATLWRQWARVNYPEVRFWRENYDLTYPMLRLNIIAAGSSSVLAFAIVLLWCRRVMGTHVRWHTGLASATAGALVLWFNPAVIWDAHCWPQWDSWLIPFFLAAVLAASLDCWLIAGISIAIGACLKGQILLGAPVLLLWPLFQFRLGEVMRLIAGFGVGLGAIVVHWMQPSAIAFQWYFMLIGALALIAPFVLQWNLKRWWRVVLPMTAAAFFLAWPWGSTASNAWRFIPILMVGLLMLARFLRSDLKAHAYIFVIAISIFLFMPLYGASASWYRVGFAYGAEKFESMMHGVGAYNTPSMLNTYLQWPGDPRAMVQVPYFDEPMPYSTATRLIYAVVLLVCGIGAAIHDYRRDPRLLAAMVAPWLGFFMLMTQMHARYSIWAAAFSALLFAVSPGMGLLGVLVACISMLGIAEKQISASRGWWPDAGDMLSRLDPHLGWIFVIALLIYLYHAIMPSRRMRNSH